MKITKVIHKWSWMLLLVFLAVGIIKPVVGIVAMLCMAAPVIVAMFKGRFWCGNYCPRGSFSDIILSKISRKRQIPKVLKNKRIKIVILITLLSLFAVQIYLANGDIYLIGKVFIRMVFVTTIITILLGVVFSQRTWCTICPMGTLATMVSKSKFINDRKSNVRKKTVVCSSCKVCRKNVCRN